MVLDSNSSMDYLQRGINGETCLHLLVGKKPFSEGSKIVDLLIRKYKELISTGDNNGLTPLHFCAMDDNQESMKVILKFLNEELETEQQQGNENNSKINLIDIRDHHGMTPLLWASCMGKKEMVELLVENGADIEMKDNRGETPFFKSLLIKNIDLMDFFQDRNCITTLSNIDGISSTNLLSSLNY
eukprot:gene9639-11816_t